MPSEKDGAGINSGDRVIPVLLTELQTKKHTLPLPDPQAQLRVPGLTAFAHPV